MTGSGQTILPPATLGLLGGGQLGLYFVRAAQDQGYRVLVLDPDATSPAGRAADRHLVAAFDDLDAIETLAREAAAVSTEFENVPAEALETLAKYIPVRPSARALAITQDRIGEKRFLSTEGIPLAPFAVIDEDDSLAALPRDFPFPAILKVSRFGYDGKGQHSVAARTDLVQARNAIGAEPCVLEQRLPLDSEFSLIAARAEEGDMVFFPAVENRHRDGILDVSIAPATLAPPLVDQARALVERIARALGYVGVLAVEFFVSAGVLRVNEIAPRPHNSGHFSLDACQLSQFGYQVRTLCGLPLAPVAQHTPAVMVNLLGDLWFRHGGHEAREPDWSPLLKSPAVHLHLYGKRHARRGRKMGHFTVLDADIEEALALAYRLRAKLGIVDGR